MRIYTVALEARGKRDPEPVYWIGKAICVIDALQLARQSVWPALHRARVEEVK